jgi:rRNA maturation endonuclease Nob1
MGKNAGSRVLGHAQGKCRGCRAWFIGPGERCPSCARLVKVKAAKRRRKR